MARPRTSTALMTITGGRLDRRKPRGSAVPLRTVPPAPEHLSAAAAAEWSRLAPLAVEIGTLTPADGRALELLAETLASEGMLREVLAQEGLTVPTADGGAKSHPALAALDRTRAQAHRLLADFGLTPRGRNYVATNKASIVDPAEEFFSS